MDASGVPKVRRKRSKLPDCGCEEDKALLAIYVDLYDDICGFIGYNYTYIVI